MKSLRVFLTVILGVACMMSAAGQNSNQQKAASARTESFKVLGNCGMCKTRIEKAAKTEGVTEADWNVKTKLLTVTYDPSKTSLESLGKKMASVGHDTEKYRAEDKVYSELPACCKYERAK